MDANAEYARRSAAALIGIENRIDKLAFKGAPVASSSQHAHALDLLYGHK